MPSVSICIPTFNYGQFIGQSLGSASAQTFRDTEILVLDNASQDNTEEIVAAAALRDPRIRYIRHSRNIGLIANFNACIETARGTYVKLLCADDSLQPDCVSRLVEAFERNSGVTLAGCARAVTDESLHTLRVARARSEFEVVSGDAMIGECFFFGNRIGEPTAVMFRRADALEGFSDRYGQLPDMEMWFRLLRGGQFAAIPDALCQVRSHPQQATWANDQSGRIIEDRRQLFREYAQSAGMSATLPRKWLWDVRMAYSAARAAAAGYRPSDGSIDEVFFPVAYRALTFPLIKAMRVLGLKLVWKTS
ncbi:MAG: glycosyltransferase family 2 protein [Steroidobacteraceae bacterium]|jgi:glycosyltransferase involved in cell wall biosynthesis